MTEADRLRAEIDDLKSRRERLVLQARCEYRPDFLDKIDQWIDSASVEIFRLETKLNAIESSATLIDIGNRLNLSER